MNDIIFAKVIAAFDEVPGAHIIDNPNQPRVLSLSSRVSLWFKKLDDNRLTANYPTDEALRWRVIGSSQRSVWVSIGASALST